MCCGIPMMEYLPMSDDKTRATTQDDAQPLDDAELEQVAGGITPDEMLELVNKPVYPGNIDDPQPGF